MLEKTFYVNTSSSVFLRWCWRRKQEWYCKGIAWPAERGEIRLIGGGYRFFEDNRPDKLVIEAFLAVPVDEQTEKMSWPFSIVEIRTEPLSAERCEVHAVCLFEPALPHFIELLRAIGERWPESGLAEIGQAATQERPAEAEAERTPRPHGDTLGRVRTARDLILRGMPKVKACRRARIDPRTFDRYLAEVTDWDGGAD